MSRVLLPVERCCGICVVETTEDRFRKYSAVGSFLWLTQGCIMRPIPALLGTNIPPRDAKEYSVAPKPRLPLEAHGIAHKCSRITKPLTQPSTHIIQNTKTRDLGRKQRRTGTSVGRFSEERKKNLPFAGGNCCCCEGSRGGAAGPRCRSILAS